MRDACQSSARQSVSLAKDPFDLRPNHWAPNLDFSVAKNYNLGFARIKDGVWKNCASGVQSIVRGMLSATLSIRLNPATKKRLELLARKAGCSRSSLAEEAISSYIDAEQWQRDEIRAGLRELDRGDTVSHEEVSKWLRSWGKRRERPAPK
jgi:predicted transcriptional regulator